MQKVDIQKLHNIIVQKSINQISYEIVDALISDEKNYEITQDFIHKFTEKAKKDCDELIDYFTEMQKFTEEILAICETKEEIDDNQSLLEKYKKAIKTLEIIKTEQFYLDKHSKSKITFISLPKKEKTILDEDIENYENSKLKTVINDIEKLENILSSEAIHDDKLRTLKSSKKGNGIHIIKHNKKLYFFHKNAAQNMRIFFDKDYAPIVPILAIFEYHGNKNNEEKKLALCDQRKQLLSEDLTSHNITSISDEYEKSYVGFKFRIKRKVYGSTLIVQLNNLKDQINKTNKNKNRRK